MLRCLELAGMASGYTAPNPLVGAVLVYNNRIIGEGYHRIYGKAHAETVAIDAVKDKSLLKHATLYVNLEPCAHHGNTPPCAQRIVQENIPEVVIGMRDPSAKVSGKGINILLEGGCSIRENVLEPQCKEINRRFIAFHEQKRPYVILKWARTLDGFIDKKRGKDAPIQPNWITNELAKRLVHRWRSQEQSILVGINTVMKDNPRLNVREWQGKDPLRIVIDRDLIIRETLHLIQDPGPAMVFTDEDSDPVKAEKLALYPTEIIRVDFHHQVLQQIMNHLYNRNILSLFVEGGAYTISRFMEADLSDEARVFTGNKTFHEGVKAPPMPVRKIHAMESLQDSHLMVFRNR